MRFFELALDKEVAGITGTLRKAVEAILKRNASDRDLKMPCESPIAIH